MGESLRGPAVCGLALFCLAVAGCGSHELRNASPTSRDLGDRLLVALAQRDDVVLRSLALSEDEFRTMVWPALPAARPERNLPMEYVWSDLQQKSARALAVALRAYGGQTYELRRVLMDTPREYAGFRVHQDVRFVVAAHDSERELRLCGSFVERNGQWKVFSFVVDE